MAVKDGKVVSYCETDKIGDIDEDIECSMFVNANNYEQAKRYYMGTDYYRIYFEKDES